MIAKRLGDQLPTNPGGPPGPKELGLCHPVKAALCPAADKRVQMK